MFSNLVFLIITLLLISLAPAGYAALDFDYAWSFLYGLAAYGCLLGFIYFFNHFLPGFAHRRKNLASAFVSVLQIAFLAAFQFYFQAYRFVGTYYMLPYTLLAFGMYLGGLTLFYSTVISTRRVFHDNEVISSLRHASMQIRMIVPFALPFLMITTFFDVLRLIPNDDFQKWLNEGFGVWYTLGLMFLVALLTMIFMPAIIQNVWLCKPLPEGDLKTRLQKLCERANFKHGGMLTWTIMNDSLTAAIVGIVPRYRYVMFTNRLLRSVSPDALEAILAHEIGHSYRKHLWIYPLIIFGMFLTTALYSYLIGDSISHYFVVQNQLHPSWTWEMLDALTIFLSYAVIVLLYFRIVFGYFSRLFERQADLHVFHLGLNPDWMIEALNDIAVQSGNIHLLPSWHHYSIQERIDLIKRAKEDPSLVDKHTRRVKLNVLVYAVLAASLLTFLLL